MFAFCFRQCYTIINNARGVLQMPRTSNKRQEIYEYLRDFAAENDAI